MDSKELLDITALSEVADRHLPKQSFTLENKETAGRSFDITIDSGFREEGGKIVWSIDGYVGSMFDEESQKRPYDVTCNLEITDEKEAGRILILGAAKPNYDSPHQCGALNDGFTLEIWKRAVNELAPLMGINEVRLYCMVDAGVRKWAEDLGLELQSSEPKLRRVVSEGTRQDSVLLAKKISPPERSQPKKKRRFRFL